MVRKPGGKFKASVLTRRQRRQAHPQGTSNIKQKGKWVCTCEIHGVKGLKPNEQAKWVKVAMPRTKRERMSGCPKCHA